MQISVKHSMLLLMISLAMLYQPTRPPTVVAVTLSQLGIHYLLNTPTYGPAAAVLAGNLIAIGGGETSEGGADMKEVYMYSPSRPPTPGSTSVIYLLHDQLATTVAVLSSTEVLVIGGSDGNRMNTVYKGTLICY